MEKRELLQGVEESIDNAYHAYLNMGEDTGIPSEAELEELLGHLNAAITGVVKYQGRIAGEKIEDEDDTWIQEIDFPVKINPEIQAVIDALEVQDDYVSYVGGVRDGDENTEVDFLHLVDRDLVVFIEDDRPAYYVVEGEQDLETVAYLWVTRREELVKGNAPEPH